MTDGPADQPPDDDPTGTARPWPATDEGAAATVHDPGAGPEDFLPPDPDPEAAADEPPTPPVPDERRQE